MHLPLKQLLFFFLFVQYQLLSINIDIDQYDIDINSYLYPHQKLLFVGDSPDLGVCRATKKNGDKCSSFVNAAKGEFCSFHVQKAYHRIGAKRGEFQSAMTGHAPKKFEQARLAKQVG